MLPIDGKKCLLELKEAKQVRVSRCIYFGIKERVHSYSLHGFGDASEKAYCAVVYLMLSTSSGNHVRLIALKTRVAPMKKLTISRLELLSGLILARLVSVEKEALGKHISFTEMHLWLDSITAIYWIKGGKDWKQFVQNHVDEILQLKHREVWHHCPGKTNHADIGSRGEFTQRLKESELWWNGPHWLKESKRGWPKIDTQDESPTDNCISARKKGHDRERIQQSVTLLVENGTANLEAIIDVSDYSESERLFRVTAWVLRFVQNLKRRIGILPKEQLPTSELANLEITRDETIWLRSVQRNVKSQSNYRQLQHELGLFEDENGILRWNGRIANAEIEDEAKFPALIRRDSMLTTLLVRRTELRTRYWIPKGRQIVNKIVSRCSVCRRYEGRSYQTPTQADLPKYRLSHKPAFSYVGIDFAGPLYIKDYRSKVMQKAYIALFSCCSSRAIHLELTTDLSAETFIRYLRRFTSRRGIPEIIVSANEKTFKAAKKMLDKIFNHPSVKKFCTSKRIAWRFNVDPAPWWDGFFERMVQEVKRCLRKSLRNAILDYDELHTVLVEIEGTLNSRPLTYVPSDELEEPFTPSHLRCAK